MADILDNDYVTQNEVKNYGVVINIPTIYVNTNENGNDECSQNLRVIKFDDLTELMNISIVISRATHDELINIWETLVEILLKSNKKMENEDDVLTFLTFASTMSKDLNIDDEYIDSTTNSISFDIIRKYINDPQTTLLLSAEQLSWNNAQLYSQLNSNDVTKARIEYNDTDMNRYLYCLMFYEKILKFEQNYVFNNTVRVANLALFYLCLICKSRPIQYLSSNDIKSNILGYIIDVIVRSRVIQAWQKQASSKILLSDMTNNYDEKQLMVAICRLPTAKLRAKYILNQLSKAKNMTEIVKCLSYEAYEELLDKTKQIIQDNEYYVFGNKFLTSAATLQGFEALKSLYTNAPEDDKNLLINKLMSDE